MGHYAGLTMDELQVMSAEQRSRRAWRYNRVLKDYRCLDCSFLIEYEERSSYFASGYCELCEPRHPIIVDRHPGARIKDWRFVDYT